MIVIAALLIVISSIDTAQAESTQIQGSIDGTSISIINDTNSIIIEKDGITSEYHNSVVKHYKSGGFSMKNYEGGILVFGHPTTDTQYKLVVITGDGIYRLIGVSSEIIEFTEPVSSVGTDISNFDIPTTGRSDYQIVIPTESHNPDSLEMMVSVPYSVEFKHDFRFDVTAIDTQIKSTNDQKLSNVSVGISMINPIGETIEIWDGLTDANGLFGNVWYVPDNQMIGEYKLHLTMEKENYTSILQMVSFFVQPIDDDGGSKCPANYTLNATGVCEIQ